MAQTLSTKEQALLMIKRNRLDLLRSWFYYAQDLDERAEKVLIWCRLFLPDYFRDTSPKFHVELIKYLFSENDEYVAAPRGFAKTTVIQGCIMYMVTYRLKKFIVILEKNGTESDEVLQAIRETFKHNEFFKKVYGDIVKTNALGVYDIKNKDAENDLMANGVRIRGKGFDTPVRGLKSRQYRPDLIVCDDIEEDQHIRSDDQRQKYYDNLTKGTIPALDIEGHLKMFGTILHYDSLLNNQIKLHTGHIYAAYDLDGDPQSTLLWRKRWPYERLEEKRLKMMQEGKGSASYYQEYHNRPVNDETRAFKQEWMQKRFKKADLIDKPLRKFTILDVAETVKDKSDYTGQVSISVNPENEWYITRAKRHKLNITGLIELIFDIWIYEKPDAIGLEKKSFDDQIRPLLKVESKKRNIYPVVSEVKHGGRAKEDRIKGALQGRFEYGMISFLDESECDDDQGQLRSELYDFPSAKHDDLSDALAYGEQFAYEPVVSSQTKTVEEADRDDSFAAAVADEFVPESWLDY